jgi:hypothetical protein
MADQRVLSWRPTKAATPEVGPWRELAPTRQREKGLWNFLTWSFFLAQVFAAQTFVGSAAAKAADDVDGNPVPSDDTTAPTVTVLAQAEAGGGAKEQASDSQQQSLTISVAIPASVTPGAPDKVLGLEKIHTTPEVAAPMGANLDGEERPTMAAAFETQPSDSIKELQGEGSHFSLGAPVGLELPAPPSGSTGPIESLDAIIQNSVAPLIGNVGHHIPSLEPIVEPAQTLTGTVSDVAHSVESALKQLALPLVADPQAALAAQVVELTTLGNSVAAAAGHAVESAIDAVGTHDVLASGGSVAFQEPSIVSKIALDDLFAGSRYTDYNLAMLSKTSIGADIQHVTTAAPNPHMHSEQLATGDPTSSQAHDHDHASTLNVTLPSPIEEIHIRGMDHGIG